MTKATFLTLTFLILLGCQSNSKKDEIPSDTWVEINTAPTDSLENKVLPEEFENKIFKEVTISRISDTLFEINGKARIFEATINWDIEDGHYILKEGFVTATAGAPSWGKFSFQVGAKKVNKHSTLLLVLFEESAVDGSRQNELPIKLY